MRDAATWATLLLAGAAALSIAACAGSRDADPDLLSHLPVWTVERELEIGREDHADYALGQVGGLAISPRGELLLSQPQERAIRVFDRDGNFLRRIGGPGDGPGEFLRLFEVGVLGDTMGAADMRARVFVQLFDTAGRPLERMEAPSPPSPFDGSQHVYPLPAGGFLRPGASSGDLMYQEHEQPWFRWDAEGALTATLPGYLSPAMGRIERTGTLPDGRSSDSPIPFMQPFPSRSWTALSPDHAAMVRALSVFDEGGVPVGVSIARYTLDGDTLAAAEIALPPRPIPAQVRDSLFEREVSRVASRLGSEGQARSELSARLSIPNHYPPLRSAVLGTDGAVWLALGDEGEGRWLRLDSALRPLATVELPPAFRLLVADGDELWGVELSELQVPRVVRLRVRR